MIEKSKIDLFWFTGKEYTLVGSLNPISAIDSEFIALFWPKMLKLGAEKLENAENRKIHTIFNILIEKSLPIDIFWFTGT